MDPSSERRSRQSDSSAAKGKYQMLSAGESRSRRIAAFVLVAFSGVCLFFSTWKPAFYAGYVSVISRIFADDADLVARSRESAPTDSQARVPR